MSGGVMANDCLSTYPADVSCCQDWNSYSDQIQCRSLVLAWDTMRLLSGGLVGNCPTTIRPCLSERCGPCTDWWRTGPTVYGGCWVNTVCGQHGCSCVPLSEILFPGPVARVCYVTVDGHPLLPNQYRLDDHLRLVRVDGESWPSCQDLSVGIDKPGSMGIEYIPGIALDVAGQYAAGVLACEYAKSCSGEKCRLPSSVTSITRQGVSMTMSTGMFSNGLTGIREVDSYLKSINPNSLMVPPKVWSPDMPHHRHTHEVIA